MDTLASVVNLSAIASRDAKNCFAQLIERVARQSDPVIITRNARPAAALLSVAEYERLIHAIPDPLATLHADFDRPVATMQTPAARAGVDALFTTTRAQLGAAAEKIAESGKH